jgi:hypothetical protein
MGMRGRRQICCCWSTQGWVQQRTMVALLCRGACLQCIRWAEAESQLGLISIPAKTALVLRHPAAAEEQSMPSRPRLDTPPATLVVRA